MKREEIFSIIDDERNHQDSMWDKVTDKEYSLLEWILIMERCMIKAKQGLLYKDGGKTTLDELRQVVSVGVACFENKGCPERKMNYRFGNHNDRSEGERIIAYDPYARPDMATAPIPKRPSSGEIDMNKTWFQPERREYMAGIEVLDRQIRGEELPNSPSVSSDNRDVKTRSANEIDTDVKYTHKVGDYTWQSTNPISEQEAKEMEDSLNKENFKQFRVKVGDQVWSKTSFTEEEAKAISISMKTIAEVKPNIYDSAYDRVLEKLDKQKHKKEYGNKEKYAAEVPVPKSYPVTTFSNSKGELPIELNNFFYESKENPSMKERKIKINTNKKGQEMLKKALEERGAEIHNKLNDLYENDKNIPK